MSNIHGTMGNVVVTMSIVYKTLIIITKTLNKVGRTIIFFYKTMNSDGAIESIIYKTLNIWWCNNEYFLPWALFMDLLIYNDGNLTNNYRTVNNVGGIMSN